MAGIKPLTFELSAHYTRMDADLIESRSRLPVTVDKLTPDGRGTTSGTLPRDLQELAEHLVGQLVQRSFPCVPGEITIRFR